MAMAGTTKNVFVLDQYKNAKLKPDILTFTFSPKINGTQINYISLIFYKKQLLVWPMPKKQTNM